MPRRPVLLVLAALLASCMATASPIATRSITTEPTRASALNPTPQATETSRMPAPSTSPATERPTSTPSLTAPPPTPRPWSLVVVGDSIPYNNPKDCPGCTGVATRYAAAIKQVTGRDVKLTNLSEYTGLRVEGLLAELQSDAARRSAIAGADVVLITIAHNNVVCPDWDLDRAVCATLAQKYRSAYDRVFAAVVGLRGGRTTAFRTVNRYNDVTQPGTTEGEAAGSKVVLDAWNQMVCDVAESNGFLCADIYHDFNGPDGLTPSGNLLARDYTHPSDLGAERIADVLANLGYAPLWP